MLDINFIKQNENLFRYKLEELEEVRAVKMSVDTAITALAKEIYGDEDFYYIINLYNNRNPFFRVKKGETINLPSKGEVLHAYIDLRRQLNLSENFTDVL